MKLKKIALAVAMLMLAGCQQQVEVVTPEVQQRMMDDLKSGKLSLTCGFSCAFTWIHKVPQIHALDMSERWQDLTVGVMQVGYGGDLAYYYLGQAAQGLGYHTAAISYYQYALALSQGADSTLRCDGNNTCQDVDIPSVVPVLVKASQDALAAQQAPAPVAPTPKKKRPASSSSQQQQQLLIPPPPPPTH